VKNGRLRKILQTAANLLTLAFLAVLIAEGSSASLEILELGQLSPSLPWFPLGIVYFAIPLGSFFMALNIIEQTWDIWGNDYLQGGR